MIVKVNLPINAYEIKIERGVLSKAGEELNLNRKVMIVTDDGVPSKYSEVLSAQCLNASVFVLEQGTLLLLKKHFLKTVFQERTAWLH